VDEFSFAALSARNKFTIAKEPTGPVDASDPEPPIDSAG
jgi:hypothetical protein